MAKKRSGVVSWRESRRWLRKEGSGARKCITRAHVDRKKEANRKACRGYNGREDA